MKKICFTLSLLIFTCLLSPAVVYPQPDDFRWSRGPNHLYPVSKWDATARVKRIGFINNAGKLVIDYDKLPSSTALVGEFHEGRAAIYFNREGPPGTPGFNIGFIDESGNMVIPPRFHQARDFSEGLAYVIGDEFRGFIDLQGKPVIKTDNNSTRDFHEGLAAVSSESGRWGYVDRSGKLVIQAQYGFADDFSEGLAGVVVGEKFGFINQKGEMIIPPRFTPRRGQYAWSGIVATSRFSEGLAPVTTEGQFDKPYKSYGYINRKGDFVIPPQFLAAQLFSEGLALVVKVKSVEDGITKVGWIDKSGEWVVTEVQGYAPPNVFSKTFPDSVGYLDWRYSEGLVSFRVYPGEKVLHGYMDRKGQVVIEPREFTKIGPFLGGIARVFVKGDEGSSDDYGYINKTGQYIWRSK